ncbi:galactose-1-phosphate uridylyltransferase [Micromonospora sp. KC723]|uniref:galactose-1-phosphate uridylyltransferase n=1 Tax=Micromonospora sp. KC723 TaxID=2530381 RepID=UPI00104882C8|nr:galactose-1-phosphate uridylyltransferase [Micromonospora sp. KC723]
MSNGEDVRPGVSLTNRYLTRDGAPVIPVSGELHYSRVPRDRWAERLRQMRAGGITVVATYVIWIHHVEQRGAPRFDGNLDVATFVDLCAEAGLDVVLRIGPWCHGEVRNGGFPDWVQRAPVRHRTDDPDYLELVREWWGQLAAALAGRCSPAGTVLGIQLENELYDQPEHLVTLKRLAREAGLSAPLWTATAWGGADLPEGEVLPLYGGYGDGFWVDADAPWDPTFRDHYFFSHVWDDPGIGADVRRGQETGPAHTPQRQPSPLFPAATCELGGGMATAYHRRPRPTARDIAAIAHCKIGNGSAWQGYYMYAGGTNPSGDGGTQESHETGYPNDMPRLGYDFHAPIGEAGTLAPSHAELRRQHAFLAAFGPRLAEMPSSLPQVRPSGVTDDRTLRWALRSDGRTGFLFVSWHQPHCPLPAYQGARFRIALDDAELVLPSRPVDIPVGTLARWPLNLTAGGVRVAWATASALTLLPGAVPTLVLVADAGIEPELAVEDDGVRVQQVTPGLAPVRLTTDAGVLDVLVLPAETAGAIWVCEDGGRRLLLSDDELRWGPDGRVTVRTTGTPRVRAYDPHAGAFAELAVPPGPVPGAVDAAVELCRPAAATVPVIYGTYDGRESAPTPEVFDDLAAVYRLGLPDWAADPAHDALLEIDWAGDVGQLRVDGRTVTDRFWDGSRWIVNLRDAGYRGGSEVTLHLLALAAGSPVSLPSAARDRLAGTGAPLLAVDRVRVVGRRTVAEPERIHRVRKTVRRMADGREIIYFDDTEPYLSGGAARTARDVRALPPADEVVRGASQIRCDPLTGEWIAMASHRNDRTFLPAADQDPLAPTAPGGFPTEVAEPTYDVVVFENRFPSFSPRVGGEPGLVDGDPLWPVRPANGRTEVVCFSAAPEGSFGSLGPHRARTVIEAWADRTEELGRLPGVAHVFVFENRGREIGVTLPHPHGQIYAFPFLPPKVARMLEMAARHREATGGALFRDVLDAERRAGTRVVVTSAHWTAYVPAAARWPVEVHLAPHRDVRDLPELTGPERDDLARIYLDVLGRLDRYFPGPEPLPYIAGVHQAPTRTGRDLFRLHVQVFSIMRAPQRLKYLAGVESAMGAWISDTTPERIAARLREVG